MSDALVISFIPGYTFTAGEVITEDKLNALGRPTINLAGTIGTTLVTDNSITTVKLVDGVLSADDAGRAKMADGYFDASATSRGKFTANFFGAGDATSLALFEDGFWTANVAGRAKFAAGFFDSTLISPTVAATLGSMRNLLAFNNAGTPNSKVDVTADEVMLKATGAPFLATSVSVTIDITASGVNGLDTGSEGPSVWYYVWLIYNGTTVSGLLSTSATAPTLPSGYTYQALVGAVRNNASSNFVTFYQQDQDIYLNQTIIFTLKQAAVSDTYEAYSAGAGGSDVDLSTVIPPIARKLRGTLGNGAGTNQCMGIAADANGLGAQLNVAAAVGSGNMVDGFSSGNGFEIPLKTAQTFYWKSTAPAARNRLSVSGYKL